MDYTYRRNKHRAGLFTTRLEHEGRLRYKFYGNAPRTTETTRDLRLAYEMYLRGLPASLDRDERLANLAQPDGIRLEWRWWLTWVNGMIGTAFLLAVGILTNRMLVPYLPRLLNRRLHAVRQNRCPRCRYSLEGLSDARCPECGAEYRVARRFRRTAVEIRDAT